MKEFVLLFRQPANFNFSSISPNEMEALLKKWKEWTGSIESQGRMVSNGIRLSTEGKVLKPGGVVTDGPFVEIRERLGGFMVIKAESLEEAVTLSHGCPAIDTNGSVEIRPVFE